MTDAAASAETSSSRPTARARALRALGVLALALVSFTPPMPPTTDLDPSWRIALAKFHDDGLRAGVDWIFTSGPLGYLYGDTYCGRQFASLIAWSAFEGLVFAAAVFWFGRRLAGLPRVLWFAVAFMLVAPCTEARHETLIGLLGLVLVLRPDGRPRLGSAACAALLAVFSLVKFSNLILAAILVGCAAAAELWRRRPAAAATVAGSFVGAYVALWTAVGERPGDLPAYLHRSWQISGGYVHAMGYYETTTQRGFGLACLASAGAYVVLYGLRRGGDARRACAALGLSAFAYVAWKHGFVRGDGHMVIFFTCALALAAAHPLLVPADDPRRRAMKFVAAAVAATALCGIESTLPGSLRRAPGDVVDRAAAAVATLAAPVAVRADYDAKLVLQQAIFDLPRTREVVGDAAVDVLGFEQAVAVIEGLDYRPRPVIQGYSAYTPELAALNRGHYEGERAPPFVLFKLQTIDNRLPGLDDAPALSVFVRRYEYVHTEKGFQLWRLAPGAFDEPPPRPVLTTTVAVGESVDVSSLPVGPLWATIDLRPSLLGRIRDFLYKPPHVRIGLTDAAGVETIWRLPLPMARTGFVLSPTFDDEDTFISSAAGAPERRVARFRIVANDSDRRFLGSTASIVVSEMKPSAAAQAYLRRRPPFHGVSRPTPTSAVLPEGLPAGLVLAALPAPGALTYDAPADSTQVSGWYGAMPGATVRDGARFRVEWSAAGRTVMLLDRTLNPTRVAGDRGLQRFSLPMPATGGRVRLLVDPGPSPDAAWDLNAWLGIEFR